MVGYGSVMIMLACVFVKFETVAVCLYTAIFVVVLVTSLCVMSVIDLVGNDSDNDCNDEQNCEQDQRLLWNHGQHYKRLIAGRGDHHSDQCAETQHPVGIE